MNAPGLRSKCRACAAPIEWLRHVTNDKIAPIDAEPVPDGNIEKLDGGKYRVARDRAGLRFKNHFATCPQASRFKRR